MNLGVCLCLPIFLYLSLSLSLSTFAHFLLCLRRCRAKSKTDPFRLMGFGHRVYKNYDPRARQMMKVQNYLFFLFSWSGMLGHASHHCWHVCLGLSQSVGCDRCEERSLAWTGNGAWKEVPQVLLTSTKLFAIGVVLYLEHSKTRTLRSVNSFPMLIFTRASVWGGWALFFLSFLPFLFLLTSLCPVCLCFFFCSILL